MNSKKSLRRKLLAYRNLLSEPAHIALNFAISQRLSKLPEIQNARYIHCFWPIIEKREFDTRPLIEQLRTNNQQIILPVVLSFDAFTSSDARMTHHLYEGETNLITNRWGVKEPARKSPFPLEKLEAIIVPALGVDRTGARLGYGKGYYDEFLSQCKVLSQRNCPVICPVYNQCLLESIPAMPHDVPVDIIVTEQEVIHLKH